MNKEDKLKNIYDLEYNTIISYFNAFIVILGSGLITFWITFNLNLNLSLLIYIKLLVSAGVILAGFIGWVLFDNKLEVIKKKIKLLEISAV